MRLGRDIVRAEASALHELVDKLDHSFFRAVRMIHRLSGDLIISGMGKAGHVGNKLSATFASTGTRSHFLHPAEAIHGDLGRVRPGDVVLLLSQSGETSEIVSLLPNLRRLGVPVIAMTASRTSTLGCTADVTIALGRLDEACSLGLAPSTSTTVMLALGDAIALVVSQLHGFAAEDFAKFHPGGALGLKLSTVEEHMRPISQCRLARDHQTIRQMLVDCTKPGRRSGAIMLTDASGKLTGLFTDSDLARLFEARNEAALDRAVSEVMIHSPTTVACGSKMCAAIDLLADRKISELPVVDAAGKPRGMIDVTDVLGMMPDAESAPAPESPTVRIFRAEESPDS